jgi:hypothetical protein
MMAYGIKKTSSDRNLKPLTVGDLPSLETIPLDLVREYWEN